MPIGPRGEMLPYNGGMGGNPGPDLPPMNPGVPNIPQGGDVMAAKQRLMQIAAEADAILTQHPELAQEMMGGGVGGVPEMPVAANTVPSGGGLLGGVV